jgi:hypothetical protein
MSFVFRALNFNFYPAKVKISDENRWAFNKSLVLWPFSKKNQAWFGFRNLAPELNQHIKALILEHSICAIVPWIVMRNVTMSPCWEIRWDFIAMLEVILNSFCYDIMESRHAQSSDSLNFPLRRKNPEVHIAFLRKICAGKLTSTATKIDLFAWPWLRQILQNGSGSPSW